MMSNIAPSKTVCYYQAGKKIGFPPLELPFKPISNHGVNVAN